MTNHSSARSNARRLLFTTLALMVAWAAAAAFLPALLGPRNDSPAGAAANSADAEAAEVLGLPDARRLQQEMVAAAALALWLALLGAATLGLGAVAVGTCCRLIRDARAAEEGKPGAAPVAPALLRIGRPTVGRPRSGRPDGSRTCRTSP
jgi:hypothetical protein